MSFLSGGIRWEPEGYDHFPRISKYAPEAQQKKSLEAMRAARGKSSPRAAIGSLVDDVGYAGDQLLQWIGLRQQMHQRLERLMMGLAPNAGRPNPGDMDEQTILSARRHPAHAASQAQLSIAQRVTPGASFFGGGDGLPPAANITSGGQRGAPSVDGGIGQSSTGGKAAPKARVEALTVGEGAGPRPAGAIAAPDLNRGASSLGSGAGPSHAGHNIAPGSIERISKQPSPPDHRRPRVHAGHDPRSHHHTMTREGALRSRPGVGRAAFPAHALVSRGFLAKSKPAGGYEELPPLEVEAPFSRDVREIVDLGEELRQKLLGYRRLLLEAQRAIWEAIKEKR